MERRAGSKQDLGMDRPCLRIAHLRAWCVSVQGHRYSSPCLCQVEEVETVGQAERFVESRVVKFCLFSAANV